MQKVNSIIDLIVALGNNGVVAKHLKLGPSAVSEMKRNSSIRLEYWPKLIKLAEQKGVELNNDILVWLHVGGKRP